MGFITPGSPKRSLHLVTTSLSCFLPSRVTFSQVCLFLPVVFRNLLLTFLPLAFPSPHIARNTVLIVIPLKLHPYTPKNWKQGPSQVHGYTLVSSIIPSSQKVETAQVSIKRRTDRQNGVYPSNETLLSPKNNTVLIHAKTRRHFGNMLSKTGQTEKDKHCTGIWVFL